MLAIWSFILVRGGGLASYLVVSTGAYGSHTMMWVCGGLILVAFVWARGSCEGAAILALLVFGRALAR